MVKYYCYQKLSKGESTYNNILHIISNWNLYKKKIESAKINKENLIPFNPKKLLAPVDKPEKFLAIQDEL